LHFLSKDLEKLQPAASEVGRTLSPSRKPSDFSIKPAQLTCGMGLNEFHPAFKGSGGWEMSGVVSLSKE
ncbi:hypothetical protein KUCAC02_026024, partial [Chaenocephalus aceratus]